MGIIWTPLLQCLCRTLCFTTYPTYNLPYRVFSQNSSALPSPTFETETFTIQPDSSFQLYYPNNLLLYQLLLRPMLSEILAIWDKSYPGQKLPHAKCNFDLMQMLQFYTLFLCFNPFFKGNNLSFELFWGKIWFCVSETSKNGV